MADNQRYTEKVAFVTGAAGGIGRATALAFAAEGAKVTVAVGDVDEAGNAETARLIEQTGGHALAVRCDVTRAEDLRTALEATVDAFGGLDVAFNNAGIEQSSGSAAADITEDEWDRIIAVSLRGVFLSMKHEIPLMLQRGGGAIVNTSSGAGIKGFAGGAAYGAAKFGVIGATKCAALDYASCVTQAGHYLFVEIAQPSRNVSFEIDYTDTSISRLRVLDLVTTAQKPRVTQLPEQVAGRTLSLDLPGWLLPKAGFSLAWTLASEEADAAPATSGLTAGASPSRLGRR